jgi:hypothetical protein
MIFRKRPVLADLADWMIATLDEIEGDPDFEDDELGDDEALPLFAFAGVTP